MTQAQAEATRKAARQGGEWHLPNCSCGHGPDDHRLDDSTNVSPVDPEAKFRCVGHQDRKTERWIDTHCDCPDYDGKMTKGPWRGRR